LRTHSRSLESGHPARKLLLDRRATLLDNDVANGGRPSLSATAAGTTALLVAAATRCQQQKRRKGGAIAAAG